MNDERINSNPELLNPENREPELYFEVAEVSRCEKGITNKDDMYNYVVQTSENHQRVEDTPSSRQA